MSCVHIRAAAAMTYAWIAIIVGGFALTAGASLLAAVGLNQTGLPLADAMNLVSIFGFLFLVFIVMWAFAKHTLRRATLIAASATISVPLAITLAPKVDLF